MQPALRHGASSQRARVKEIWNTVPDVRDLQFSLGDKTKPHGIHTCTQYHLGFYEGFQVVSAVNIDFECKWDSE